MKDCEKRISKMTDFEDYLLNLTITEELDYDESGNTVPLAVIDLDDDHENCTFDITVCGNLTEDYKMVSKMNDDE